MNERPHLRMSKSPIESMLDILALSILLASIIYLILSWPRLPEQIPIHFNAAGQADNWGGKSTLIVLPILSALLFGGLLLLRKIPHHFNYPMPITPENAAVKYRITLDMIGWLRFQVVILFSYILFGAIRAAEHPGSGLGFWFLPILLLSLIGTIVFYFNRLMRRG